MGKTKRQPVKASNIWTCCVCKGNPEFEHAAMMKHLRKKHGIDTKTTKAHRRMLMHVDGADFFTYTYEWELQGMKFIQNTVSPRRTLGLKLESQNYGIQKQSRNETAYGVRAAC